MSDEVQKPEIPVQPLADDESPVPDNDDRPDPPSGDDSAKGELPAWQERLQQNALGELSERREQLAYLGKLSAAIALGAASILARYLSASADACTAVCAEQLTLPDDGIRALLACILFMCFYTTWRGLRFSKHAVLSRIGDESPDGGNWDKWAEKSEITVQAANDEANAIRFLLTVIWIASFLTSWLIVFDLLGRAAAELAALAFFCAYAWFECRRAPLLPRQGAIKFGRLMLAALAIVGFLCILTNQTPSDIWHWLRAFFSRP